MQVHIQVNCHFGKSVFQDRTTVMADEVTNLLTKEHCAINSDDEVAPLLVKKTSSTWWSRCVLRYKTTRKSGQLALQVCLADSLLEFHSRLVEWSGLES